MDPSVVSVLWCDGRGEWRKVETFNFVQNKSSGVPAFADAVHSSLESLIHKLKASNAYADNLTAFVKSRFWIDEVGNEISMYETVTGAKIKSVGLRLRVGKGVSLLKFFTWTDGSLRILGV